MDSSISIGGDVTNAEKVRENRLRRMAERQGMRLVKSRRRDPLALDYGKYWLVRTTPHGRRVELVDLDDVERFLTVGSEATR